MWIVLIFAAFEDAWLSLRLLLARKSIVLHALVIVLWSLTSVVRIFDVRLWDTLRTRDIRSRFIRDFCFYYKFRTTAKFHLFLFCVFLHVLWSINNLFLGTVAHWPKSKVFHRCIVRSFSDTFEPVSLGERYNSVSLSLKLEARVLRLDGVVKFRHWNEDEVIVKASLTTAFYFAVFCIVPDPWSISMRFWNSIDEKITMLRR